MGKDSGKKLVGQPIFKQMIDLLPKEKFESLVYKHGSDRYYKRFTSWRQLVTMLFGAYSRCDSMSEVCAGMQALEGKLSYFGMDSSPAKSTAGDGLRDRSNELFRDFYFTLIEHFKPVFSVSRIEKASFDKLYAFDSTTISLFSDILKGVGRDPKGDGKKKGGLKVHMLTDVHSETAQFAYLSEASQHDRKFLDRLSLSSGSMIVFDRAYNDYKWFAEQSGKDIWFVCRMKNNAKYEVQQVVLDRVLEKDPFGVLKEEHVHLGYKDGKEEKTLCLRRIIYKDEKRRIYVFITNNFDITAEEAAFLYKKRWTIELLFKKLKGNFQLSYFYSETENGIKTQIWCTLIACLLLMVLMVKTKTQKAFSTVATLIRIYLISHQCLFWVIQNSMRTYTKKLKCRNKSPGIQLSFL
ncbi:hypothetical protein M2480_003242 [Parabacteroides sp. PFB2-12]|nr:IS4 family transposase [Parabacteroides sp. PFB2-12]MDH6392229.1 hypothetical protein [Parabacteroides sp. PFB2-12]